MSGPSLPGKVAKTLNTQILFASAHLSDLAAQGKVKISSLKIGGSPLYYLPGQEQQLYNFAPGNINPKDLLVLNKLKEEKIVRESQLELLEKVALRSLKDFAVPLQVTVDGKAELFWKWHLLSEEETTICIERLLTPPRAEPELPAEEAPESPVAPVSRVTREEKKEVMMPEPDDRKNLGKQPRVPKKRVATTEEQAFFPAIELIFRKLSLTIEQKETVRKNKELNFILKVPSAVGPMTYFGKARNKSKCDEKDLSAAYMEAQIKKLPLLFLHTGELSKKAQEMLRSGAFENVMVRKVGS